VRVFVRRLRVARSRSRHDAESPGGQGDLAPRDVGGRCERHVTVHDQLVSFTGTMRVEAELDIADALDLEAAVAVGADQRAAWGSPEPLDVRRAQAVGDLARRQLVLDLGHPEVSRARPGHGRS